MGGGEQHFRRPFSRWWWLALGVAPLLLLVGTLSRVDAERRMEEVRVAAELHRQRRMERSRAARRIADFAPRYRELVAAGVIDEGRRALSAARRVEALRRVGEGVALARYRIEPPERFSLERGRSEEAGIVGVALSLRLLLRHEGELLERLERLRAADAGRLRVEGCELTRREGAPLGGPLLEAVCELRWLSVRRDGCLGDGEPCR